ncbi:UDP-galactopyranose mutase [Omnitrophica bacterium]|nr:UDP-galactopyranose mutase [Candidatus Omnitrophota bacterium]
MKCDFLIVGAGLFGSVLAERIANDLGLEVVIIDKRPHVGGNCYSETDHDTAIECHQYGTHIFHTDSLKVWQYINRFTAFNSYHHQVLTMHKKKLYQMPINLETINSFYQLNLKPQEARDFILKKIKKAGIVQPKNLEEKAISLIGEQLYEAFIRGYTIKQWGKDPKELPANIITRLPVRYNYNETYFRNSRWEGLPLEGYTAIFKKLLNSEKIKIRCNCDYFKARKEFQVRYKTIYTGPVDQFFDYQYGALQWRSLKFESKRFDLEDFQGTSVINYADEDTPFSRTHEFRHLHPERSYRNDKTIVAYETPVSDAREPYYPIASASNRELYQKYSKKLAAEKNLLVGGRLGSYAYIDMDQTILAALGCYKDKIYPAVRG